ncbi:MAG: hypothetical protein AAFZ15_13095 [Bacteroidota bacterium]
MKYLSLFLAMQSLFASFLILGCAEIDDHEINNFSEVEEYAINAEKSAAVEIFKKEKRSPDLNNYFVQRAGENGPADTSRIERFTDFTDYEFSMLVFNDLINLRDEGDSLAVPVLVRLLDRLRDEGNFIHKYAALQALFCIASKQAHDYLADYMIPANVSTRLSMNYAEYYGMDADYKLKFIEQYHLAEQVDELKIEVFNITDENSFDSTYLFKIKIKNQSTEPVCFHKSNYFLGNYLMFLSEEGRLSSARSSSFTELNGGRAVSHLDILPEDYIEFEIPLTIKRINPSTEKFVRKMVGEGSIYGAIDKALFNLKEAGTFRVFAFCEYLLPSGNSPHKFSSFDQDYWVGKLVSEPILVDIK